MPRASVPDALLRLWVLADLGLAGLHFWLAWGIRDWPADGPAPQPLRMVAITEFMALFLIVPAAIVAALRWRKTRDRELIVLGIGYGALLVMMLANAALADTAGAMRGLRAVQVGLSLAGIAVALRALRLR